MSRGGISARVVARVGALALDVDLDAGEGTLALVGPNGAGKTSLLSVVLGAWPADRGRIEVTGEVLLDTAKGIEVPPERRQLGYVPQDLGLFPHLTVRGNVDFAVASQTPTSDRSERARRVGQALHDLGIEAIASRFPRTLSGGEKQRVALARALSARPRALLLDEPLGSLDARAREEVRSFLGEYLARLAIPTWIVTHDARDARALAARIAVLEAGRITQVGSWDELVAAPATPFVEELVGRTRA